MRHRVEESVMPDPNCIFCKIAAGEIASEIVHADERVVAFRDTNPQAPTHVLVIPRKHIATINDLDEGDAEDVGRLFLVAAAIARQAGIDRSGYRVAMNCGEGAGQSVFHIHLHLLGGRRFRWPPG
jgi:histidine triad (HIT) family protein